MPASDSSFSSSASSCRPGLPWQALASAAAPPRRSWFWHASRCVSCRRPTSACKGRGVEDWSDGLMMQQRSGAEGAGGQRRAVETCPEPAPAWRPPHPRNGHRPLVLQLVLPQAQAAQRGRGRHGGRHRGRARRRDLVQSQLQLLCKAGGCVGRMRKVRQGPGSCTSAFWHPCCARPPRPPRNPPSPHPQPFPTHLQLWRGAGGSQRGAHRGHALVTQARVVQDQGLRRGSGGGQGFIRQRANA